MRTLAMPIEDGNKELIEGHPLLVSKIIKGDLRTKTWEADGVIHTSQNEDGLLLYDKTDKRERPWFILAYESGNRVVD